MLTDLSHDERQLADLMSAISERCYYAGWIENLEYILWASLNDGVRKYGHDIISQEDIDKLGEYSRDLNCWIYMDEITEETAIDLLTWRKMFDKELIRNP